MLAFVFPGQGSQYCGMGRDVFEAFPEARRVFEESDEALNLPLTRLCFEGPAEQLILTEYTQPALLTASIAISRVLIRRGKRPDYVAGHSLGEYSAAVTAGGISFRDAVKAVHLRGKFMQEAVPFGEGAMAALLGLGLPEVGAICRKAAQEEIVSPANINAPDQIVIAGHTKAVQRAADLAREQRSRVIPLSVSAPFHCALMKPAQDRLAEVLEEIEFSDLKLPLVNNLEARAVLSAEDVKEGLIGQVTAAVRWTDCVETLREAGVSGFVEVGPGKVLTGLLRKIDRMLETANVGSTEQLKAYV